MLRVLISCFLLFGLNQSLGSSPVSLYSENFPPYNYLKNNKPQGVAVEVVQAIMADQGIHQDIRFAPWPRIYNYALKRPNIAIFSTAYSQERKSLFKWVGPICEYTVSFYTAGHRDIRIDSIEQAKQLHSIAIATDTEGVDILNKLGFNNVSSINKSKLIMKQLLHGRVDSWIEADATVEFLRQKYKINQQQLRPQLSLYRGQLYIAFSKDVDDSVIARWQASLDQIKTDGRYQKILERYGLSPAMDKKFPVFIRDGIKYD